MANKSLSVDGVVICDDVRIEAATRKSMILGVYGGDIRVMSFPANIALATWIEMTATKKGEVPFEMRVRIGSKIFGTILGEIKFDAPGPAGLNTPPLPMHIEKKGEIVFEMKLGKGAQKWMIVKRKTISAGFIPSISPPLPSSQSRRASSKTKR